MRKIVILLGVLVAVCCVLLSFTLGYNMNDTRAGRNVTELMRDHPHGDSVRVRAEPTVDVAPDVPLCLAKDAASAQRLLSGASPTQNPVCIPHVEQVAAYNLSVLDADYSMIRVSPYSYCLPRGEHIRISRQKSIAQDSYALLLWQGKLAAHVANAEDPRPFYLHGHIWCVFARPDRTARISYTMHLARVAPNTQRIVTLTCDKMRRVEKNWVPLVHDDTLYLLYSLSPVHRVLRCDTASGQCVDVHHEESARLPALRGGSQAVACGDAYVGVAHTTETATRFPYRAYVHYFYLLAPQPPFAVQALSPPWIFPPHFYDAKDWIQFCSGLSLQGDDFVLTYGVGDCLCKQLRVPRDRVLAELRAV